MPGHLPGYGNCIINLKEKLCFLLQFIDKFLKFNIVLSLHKIRIFTIL